jgi:uncharacterized protein (TIGR02145 family)
MPQKRFAILSLVFLSVLGLMTLYSCNKKNNNDLGGGLPSVTDYDKNIYKTVKIGNQIWMVGALKVTHYNDGTPIPHIATKNDWAKTITGARCYQGEAVSDSARYAATYGALYNWAAVNSGKLAPKGYHVPDTSDFRILISSLGGPSIAGHLLKSANYWEGDYNENYPLRNSSGFTALPAGWRHSDGSLYFLGIQGNLWSSRQVDNGLAYYQGISNVSATSVINSISKLYGLQVVCVKD